MSVLTDLFAAQLAVLKSDFATDLVPVLQKSMNLLSSNPTELNLLAQAESILVQAQAEVPKLGQDELTALTQWINARLQAMVAAQSPPAKP